jgi:hypothetical protein
MEVLEVGAGKIASCPVVIGVVRQVDAPPAVEVEGERHPAQFPCAPREVLVQGSELQVVPSRDIPLEVEKVCL